MKRRQQILALLLTIGVCGSSVSAYDTVKYETADIGYIKENNMSAATPVPLPIDGETDFDTISEISAPSANVSDRYIVKYKTGVDRSNLFSERSIANSNIETINDIEEDVLNSESITQIIELEEAVAVSEFIENIEELPDIEYVQPDYRLELSEFEPSETEEGMHTVESGIIEEFEEISIGSSSTVALIDTGVDIEDERLAGHMKRNNEDLGLDEDGNGYLGDICGWDFYNDNPEVYNDALGMDQAHGTFLAGIIAESAINAKIMPLKVFENGVAYTSDIIEAIHYADIMGADIVNCSWGCTEENRALKEAMESTDMIFVCAAGNNRMDLKETPMYPACFDLDNVISVTSVNEDGGLSYFSNYGDADIAAWGRDVPGIFPAGESGELSGTSVSAGFVTGALADVINNTTDPIASMYAAADKLLNLQNYVSAGRRLNIDALRSNRISSDIIDINPTEDFNMEGYTRTPEQSWELFSSLDNVTVEAGCDFFMVLKRNGTVWTWGRNDEGELGIGNYTAKYVPQQIPNLNNVVEIAAGNNHALARTADGYVYSWGSNYNGCLGIGSTTKVTVPVRMTNGTGVTGINAGASLSYVLKNGDVYVCGSNDWGAIGDGTKISRTTLTKINLSGIKKVAGDAGASFAISDTGALYSWGHDGSGRLGDGNGEADRYYPEKIIESGVKDVSMGFFDCIALMENGDVYNWGYSYGDTPVKNNGVSGVDKVISARQTQFALKGTTIKSRGFNDKGQLGVGDTSYKSSFTNITGNFTDFDIYEYCGIALGTNGCIYTWGVTDFDTMDYTTAPEKLSHKINDFGGDGFSEATDIELGLTNGNIISVDDVDYYKFTPAESGRYSIYSVSNIDMMCNVYEKTSGGTYVLKYSNDDGGKIMSNNSLDFYTLCDFTKDVDYYIKCNVYDDEIDEYKMYIAKEKVLCSYSFSGDTGANADMYINVSNIPSFVGRTFHINYNSSELELIDGCVFTQSQETLAGNIKNTNINIISVSDGKIVFSVNQDIPEGKKLSGTINIIRFNSLVTGNKTVEYETSITDIS